MKIELLPINLFHEPISFVLFFQKCSCPFHPSASVRIFRHVISFFSPRKPLLVTSWTSSRKEGTSSSGHFLFRCRCPKLIATSFLSSIYPDSCCVVPCPPTTVSLIKRSSPGRTTVVPFRPRSTAPKRFADVPDYVILIDRHGLIDFRNEPDEHKEERYHGVTILQFIFHPGSPKLHFLPAHRGGMTIRGEY